jgi:hypothetical protein
MGMRRWREPMAERSVIQGEKTVMVDIWAFPVIDGEGVGRFRYLMVNEASKSTNDDGHTVEFDVCVGRGRWKGKPKRSGLAFFRPIRSERTL